MALGPLEETLRCVALANFSIPTSTGRVISIGGIGDWEVEVVGVTVIPRAAVSSGNATFTFQVRNANGSTYGSAVSASASIAGGGNHRVEIVLPNPVKAGVGRSVEISASNTSGAAVAADVIIWFRVGQLVLPEQRTVVTTAEV